ncbi:RING finger and CHY zinc finger domain-containing protein 1, partial [Geodia barretti]
MGEQVGKMDEDVTDPPVGDYRKLCSHYSRGCSFVSPCCGKVYPCRLCHDDQELTHKIDRYRVTEVQCRNCHKKQPVSLSFLVSQTAHSHMEG